MALGIVCGATASTNNANEFELILSKDSLSLQAYETDTFTITTPSNGQLFVLSSDTNIVKVSLDDNVVHVQAIEYGIATITCWQEATDNYPSPKSVSCVCVVEVPGVTTGSTFETTTWENISLIANQGIGSSYWSIGDTKRIILNGNIYKDDYTNTVYTVFILHFNYPIDTNEDNNIILGGFKDLFGNNVALTASISSTATTYNIHHYNNTQYGGWKGCDLRYDILGATNYCPTQYGTTMTTARTGYDANNNTLKYPHQNTLLAALPKDFRSVLRLWTRYTNNSATGKGTSTSSITECIDAVTLLTEFEIFGTRRYANNYEQQHQSYIEYYSSGNSRIMYDALDVSTPCVWWTASPYVLTDLDNGYWIYINISGNIPSAPLTVNAYQYNTSSGNKRIGIVPAFKV